MNKYEIVTLADFSEEWDSLVQNSQQGSIFFLSNYVKSFCDNYKLILVKKGDAYKAGCLVLSIDNQILLEDLIIYSGIFFINDATQKPTKALSQRFEITQLLIEFLDANYKTITMQLSPEFEDVRPFLWHNYHSQNQKEKFTIDIRYTSYLDISSLSNSNNALQSILFNELETLRQRNIKEARKKEAYTKIQTDIVLFLEFYEKLLNTQHIVPTQKKLNDMHKLIDSLIKNKLAKMYISYNANDQIQYITIFCFDAHRAYYLFGAPNPQAKERYKGTICFWDAFVDLAKNGIKEVDMEGVNSPQRGWFKLSFGGFLKPYYKVMKACDE